MRSVSKLLLAACLALVFQPAAAQIKTLETDHLRLVYYGQIQDDLVRHTARSFENSFAFHERFFDYAPSEPVTVLLHDLNDYGNAGALSIPRNLILVGIAPFRYVFETAPANERMNATMNHEMMHIVAQDKAAGRDVLFRKLFGGKVVADEEDPVSVLYSFLTNPRRFAPRWYQEGIAVFMETWMAGGLGRSLGGYDEMVFRTLVHDKARIYDMVGLETEGTAIDFQVGVNAYLYGTRFMGYLALTYGPEKVVEWVSRTPGSKAYFVSQFAHVFGRSITEAWRNWISFEEEFQALNLQRVAANPITEFRPLSNRALGSVSRAYYDADGRRLYAAVNFPGQVAHIASLDIDTGRMEHVVDVKGASLYEVASLVADPDRNILFYTTDNVDWRDVREVDLATGKTRTLLTDARIGDLAFNRTDRSLWGIRHNLGISTIVRIPYPYEEWNQVYSWPYGQDLYDIDVSPDGTSLTGALAVVSGRQTLIRMSVDSLLAGVAAHETLFDFDLSNPEGFTFSPDGRYLYGTSYLSGVSNVYRYDLEAARMEAYSNTDTGFFRPMVASDDSLVVLRYSSKGFTPAMVPNRRVPTVRSVNFLGQEIVERHEVVRSWLAGSPGAVKLDSLITYTGDYGGLGRIGLASAYPIVQGYRNYVGVGVRLNFSEPIGFHRVTLSATYTPTTELPEDERFHVGIEYRHRGWTVAGSYNAADFYDLFGPTRTSRKGVAMGVRYDKSLLDDAPRALGYWVGVKRYTGLDRLPDYQNVQAPFSELVAARAALHYENLSKSLGAVDKEKGVSWTLTGQANFVRRSVFMGVHGEYDVGRPMPIPHSSLWLRTAAGASFGDRTDPFGNFYFGGFGNNWVDYQDEMRFRSYYSFPGVGINDLGGSNFAKALVEWILPPLHFRQAGGTSLVLKWARISLFSGGLVTDIDREDLRSRSLNAGAQLDLRLTLFSYFNTTLSAGWARARLEGGAWKNELMVSLKLL